MKKNRLFQVAVLMLPLLMLSIQGLAQNVTVRGIVRDEAGAPLVGVNVFVDGTTIGVATNIDGSYQLNVSPSQTITYQYLGYEDQSEAVGDRRQINVTLVSSALAVDEVVVIGFGQQKKASVVGAITQTTGEVLQRSAGQTNLGAALTGNLPGVVTVQSSGQPGNEEDLQITVRASSTWNDAKPLILVDGIKREMGSVDINSVESISVLKDASATAVYGVEGANGVLLITTRRGQEGRAQINVGFTASLESVSKLPNKLDSYDALIYRNKAVEHELALSPGSWADIRSMSFINMYRNQTTVEQRERYANVDWQEVLFKDFAMSYNANVGISGGTKAVKYFVSADYANEGDMYARFDNYRSYQTEYSYNRMNVRANLDFQITPTTLFSMNLAGSNGIQKKPRDSASIWEKQQNWAAAYTIAPDVFLPQYSDGSWGFYPDNQQRILNSAKRMSTGGQDETTTTRITTDFILVQKLDFITEGLQARGSVSWDNQFQENGRGINDPNSAYETQMKWIDPVNGEIELDKERTGTDQFDFSNPGSWSISNGSVGGVTRNLHYQLQLNWNRTFGQHSLSAMGVFTRQERASGNGIPSYREDWAFRATYDFASKYMFEYNGAYNGSEKFAKEYRFAFFNSGALGWMISEEQFMKPLTFLDMLKVRYSYGEIGDDSSAGQFPYMSDAASGGALNWGSNGGTSIYHFVRRENTYGNPDIRWETVVKQNFGIDYSFLNGLFAGTVEIFKDKRRDIVINGSQRAVPSFLIAAPSANLGKVETQGYELELRFNKSLNNGMRLWANMNMTHATSKVIEQEDPEMYPSYRKKAGYAINQTTSVVDGGFINTFDQLYGSAPLDSNDQNKLPGDYNLIDFNNDGIVDSKDQVPFGYSTIPENTYNATLGIDWKGFSAFVQFYGVSNVTRYVPLATFVNQQSLVFDVGTWWSKDTPNADATVPRFRSVASDYRYATQFYYDGSYLRLKNAEIAYTFTGGWIKKLGMGNLRLYVNGNNLWLWTKMPDDRESNLSGYDGGGGAYPTVRRFNLGVRFTL